MACHCMALYDMGTDVVAWHRMALYCVEWHVYTVDTGWHAIRDGMKCYVQSVVGFTWRVEPVADMRQGGCVLPIREDRSCWACQGLFWP